MPTNGRLNLSTLTLVDGWAYLEPATARAWIAACDELVALGYRRPTITKPDGAYRDYDGQVRMKTYWTEQGIPLNAATPGTSNHGWGTCVDIFEYWRWPRKVLVDVMERHGFVFDYPPELWHAHRTSINPADNYISAASLDLTPIEQEEETEMAQAGAFYRVASGQGVNKIYWQEEPNAPLLELDAVQWYTYEVGGAKFKDWAAEDLEPLMRRCGTYTLDKLGRIIRNADGTPALWLPGLPA